MIQVDMKKGVLSVKEGEEIREIPFSSPEAFSIISKAWLRVGWDTKYVYGFTWLGRPVIQLPDDMIRIQEVIYSVKPDVIVETGIAHGGSLVYYASILRAMGSGHVIGVDIEIRPHNREAIESHELFEYITLIEGDSTDKGVVQQVASQVQNDQRVLVILDANHTKSHVLEELRSYSELVSVDSYIVACDGIMGELAGAPRTEEDWTWNNPRTAVEEFVAEDDRFIIEEMEFPFNEGAVKERVTYWPSAFVKRIRQ
jgi:cephalosporin hydroxylase